MSKPMIKIHNADTGEIVEREMNAAEIKQNDADLLNAENRKAEKIAKEASRQAVLAKLGVTADEVAALLG
jgi:hypothetical protein